MSYDAATAPDPEAWLELDEQERIDQVTEYHERRRLPVGESLTLHVIAHVIVENQIAMGDPPATRETLARLIREGLHRHDAVHAVGTVVMGIVFDAAQEKGDAGDVNAKIGRKLAELTATSWRGQ